MGERCIFSSPFKDIICHEGVKATRAWGCWLHYTWVKKKRRRLVLSSLSAFHTVQHFSQQMVPPTVCSTSHASFNLIKKPHRHAQKRISLVTLDPPRSLLTEPPASLPFLVSTGSLYSLAHPPALWSQCQQYDTFRLPNSLSMETSCSFLLWPSSFLLSPTKTP